MTVAGIEFDTWRDRARCKNHPQVDFFPSRHGKPESAIAVCMNCPVVKDCYEDAQANPTQSIGVWGGTTYRQRLRIRNGTAPVPTWVQ